MDASFTAEEHFLRGEEALRAERHEEALEHFRAANRLDATRPLYRSFYGLLVGLSEKRFDRALELCRSAAREEFFDPEHYHNLAQLHLAFGFKAEAIRYLRRGQMIDPDNPRIHTRLADLGVRRRPPLLFLRRQHLLNRLLGRLRGHSSIAQDPELSASSV